MQGRAMNASSHFRPHLPVGVRLLGKRRSLDAHRRTRRMGETRPAAQGESHPRGKSEARKGAG